MDVKRALLLFLCIALASSLSPRRQRSGQPRKKRRELCRKRPDLPFCKRLLARLKVAEEEEEEDDGGSVPVPDELFPLSGQPDSDGSNARNFLPPSTLAPQPQPQRATTPRPYCQRWAGHNVKFCRRLDESSSERVKRFCGNYARRCPRPPPASPFQSQGEVELIEEATPAPGGAIQRMCAENRILGERFCVSGTPPRGYEKECRNYRLYCILETGNEDDDEGDEEDRQPLPGSVQSGRSIRLRCAQYQGLGQRFCSTALRREPRYEAFCYDYRKYCADVPSGEPRDFRTIAGLFDSGVDLGDSFNLGGIPFYPFNPQHTIGFEDTNPITFGTWGGGYGERQGVTDFWRRESNTGANWYNGFYGTDEKFGVPMFGGLFSGVDESNVNVPIFDGDFGDPITVGDRFSFGPFVSTGDAVGVDWLGGGVSDRDSVSIPFVGTSVNTGNSLSFPSVGGILGSIPLGADKEVVDQLIRDRKRRQRLQQIAAAQGGSTN